MKDKSLSVLIGVLVVAVIGVGYFVYRLVFSKKSIQSTATPTTAQVNGPQKGDIDYNEPTTTVKIGTDNINAGNFVKVEAGKVYYQKGSDLVELPLTVDEVVIACTNQNLAGASELDYNQVASVDVTTPAEVGGKIPANEPVVVFADDVNGVLRAHTIALAASSCE